MTISRRLFIVGASIASVSAVTVPQSVLGQKMGGEKLKPRVRTNVKSLDRESPDIASMSKAIESMKKTKEWLGLAEIHGNLRNNEANHCKHRSWLFLPWHRAYLHCLELIIIDATKNTEFGLPYWDWENDHAMPDLFSGLPASLNNPARGDDKGSGRTRVKGEKFSKGAIESEMGPAVSKKILGSKSFMAVAGGSQLSPRAGSIEAGPHQFLHSWIGGDMLRGGCPFDPLFWLVHSNVDRLWERWARQNPNLHPGDKNWLNTPFPEFDPWLKKAYGKTLDVEDILHGFGYRYDDFADPTVFTYLKKPIEEDIFLTAADGNFFKEELGVGVSPQFPRMDDFVNRFADPKGDGLGVLVHFDEFSPQLPPDLIIRVYLVPNDFNGTVDTDTPGFIGSFIAGKCWEHKHHEPNPFSVTLDATLAFRRLIFEANPRVDSMKMLIVAHRINGGSWEGIQNAFPKKVTILGFKQQTTK